MNLYEVFRRTAGRQPQRPAILGPGRDEAMSYGDLAGAVDAAGERLAAAGLRPGDCVGLHCPSGAEYIILTYAVWRNGGCVVPVPIELTASEKQELCRGIALDFVLSAESTADVFDPFRSGQGEREHGRATSASVVFPVRSPRAHPSGFERINSAFIRFTSGTTGASKGVVLSHETIHERIHAANEVLHVGPDDRVVWLLSMSYHFAVTIVGYLSFGAAVVLPRNHYAPEVAGALHRHGATLVYGSPFHYALLADFPEGVPPERLRLALSTTAALDSRVAAAFQERYGRPVSQALGIIEIGLPCINVDFAADRCDGVGRVLPAYRLRLEDVGLGPRAQGLAFRGQGFLDAYYDPWQPREALMPDGWFRTGDVGELDGDGCLFLRGRVNDVINVMGMKFFPQEVEAVLESHPAVREACVFPHRDERMGEVPHARVVPCPSFANGASAPAADHARSPLENELLRHCRQRLAAFKVPARIEPVAALDRTASGKLLRVERVP